MMQPSRRRAFNLIALFLLLGSLIPAATLLPQRAHAEGRLLDEPQAPSADSSEEIVYVDGNGFIRVLDIYFTGKQVQWVSPTGNWRSIALGDFDNDGDFEIAAVRGTPGGSTPAELTVFDPVVAKGGIIPGQSINDIPWKVLYTLPLPGRPELVFAGNFDPNVPGDEIGIVRAVAPEDGASPGDITRVLIYKQTSANPDGTTWTIHQRKDFSDKWERVAVGNLDRAGGDEVAFVDQDQGKINVFQPDANFRRIDGIGGSDNFPFKDVAFGQYLRGGNREMLVVRDGDQLNSFLIYEYDSGDNSVDAKKGERFAPSPRIIFAGDINGGNDDDEAIMIRNCTTGSCAHLIVRNDGNDGVVQDFINGLRLDADNGWRAGAAGDIDGDDRDEIVIIRDNKIRWYPDAHNSTRHEELNLSTDRKSIHIGDLDRKGYISGPVFGVTPSQVQETAFFGFRRTGTLQLQNISTFDAVPFQATTGAAWLTISPATAVAPGANSAPLALTYEINATALQPGQRYTSTITFTGANVANSPFSVPVYVDVQLPPFGADPTSATAFYYPCVDPLETQDLQMNIIGFPGNRFTARVLSPLDAAAASALQGNFFLGAETEQGIQLTDAAGAQATIAGNPALTVAPAASASLAWPSETPWVTAVASPVDTLPTTLTLTISPTLRTVDFARTTLLLQSTDPLNPAAQIFSTHQIVLACAANGIYMPFVDRP